MAAFPRRPPCRVPWRRPSPAWPPSPICGSIRSVPVTPSPPRSAARRPSTRACRSTSSRVHRRRRRRPRTWDSPSSRRRPPKPAPPSRRRCRSRRSMPPSMSRRASRARSGSRSVTLPATETQRAPNTVTPSVAPSQPNQPPAAAFTASCPTLTCSFTDQSSDPDGTIATWHWDFGDGSTPVTTRNPSHTYSTGGSYTVTLTVTDNQGAPNTVTHSVAPSQPNQPPTAAFTASCPTLTCSFTDQSSDPDGSVTSWQWTFGDGTSGSTTQNPSHTYSAGGSYTVTLTVKDNQNASSSPVSHTVQVTAPNQPPSVTAGGEQTVLIGALFSLTGAGFSDPNHDGPWTVTINWGDGTSSTSTASSEGSIGGSHSYPLTLLGHDYTLTVTVVDAHGARGSASKTVHVVVA